MLSNLMKLENLKIFRDSLKNRSSHVQHKNVRVFSEFGQLRCNKIEQQKPKLSENSSYVPKASKAANFQKFTQ